jgi:UDP-glucose 4-epimerase
MNVLVTGGAGFIGSHVVDRLVNDGHQVRIIDNLSSGKLENIQDHLASGRVKFEAGDIRNSNVMAKNLEGIEAVVHLAAIISVPLSVKNPSLTFDTNFSGTLNMLQLSANKGVRRFIFASSCAVYGDPASLPITEAEMTKPISPYAESKLKAEQACLELSGKHILESVVLRFFNVYGPRQANNEYSGVITRFIERIKQELPLIIYGNGAQTRDFVNVKDVVGAIVASITRAKAEGEILNIGTGKPTSVNELAKTVTELAGAKSQIIYKEKRVGEIENSFADITKAKRLLDFEPSVSLKEGLRDLIA